MFNLRSASENMKPAPMSHVDKSYLNGTFNP